MYRYYEQTEHIGATHGVVLVLGRDGDDGLPDPEALGDGLLVGGGRYKDGPVHVTLDGHHQQGTGPLVGELTVVRQ